MANLMGLLLGASAAKLHATARYWQIDADGEPRTLVSKLYDEMTDEYAVKSILERLSPPTELVLAKIMTAPKGWVAVPELTNSLPFDDEETDQILADLQDAGIVIVETVRVSRNEILEGPVYLNRGRTSVQMTVARIPQDLLRILQRIRYQMTTGDQSDKRLHKFLGELDLPQLQLLCERWHLSDAQQRFKKDLMIFLETRLGQSRHVNEALQRLGEDAQLVFRAVQNADGRVSLAAIHQSLELDGRRIKQAVSTLTSLFLLQETYVGDDRYVFIPTGVGIHEDTVQISSELDTLLEVPEPGKASGVDYAFFFDFLALLNYFEQHRVELTLLERKIPRRVTTEIREQLTISGNTGQRSARLDYLFHIARELKLLETRDGRVVANAKVKEWAALGIADQAKEMFQLWLSDDVWKGPNPILSAGQSSEFCAEMRRRLADCLKKSETGKWYSFDSIVALVAADLGIKECADQEVPCSASPYKLPGMSDVRIQSLNVVRLFQWMSFLSLGSSNGGGVTAVQLTPPGAWVLGCEGATKPEYREASLNIGSNFEVMVGEPDTLVWHNLLKFSLTFSIGRASVHQITKRKVQQAVYWGLSAEELVGFLKAKCRHAVPENVIASIDEWAKGIKIVSLEKLIILEVDTHVVLDELLACPKYSKWFGRRISETAIVVQDTPDIKKLMREMRSDGFFPRLDY